MPLYLKFKFEVCYNHSKGLKPEWIDHAKKFERALQ